MKISEIVIRSYQKSNNKDFASDGLRHIKEMPYLSIVQATRGYYSFGLNGAELKDTAEGGCFIAPAAQTQEIVHHARQGEKKMSARWVFIDVYANGSWRLDSLFSFPAVPDACICKKINDIFNVLFSSDNPCDDMICCYRLIKLLLSVSMEKKHVSESLNPALEYIAEHYRERLSVKDIADSVHLSESRLYSVFKKEINASPIEYLNNYRLLCSCFLLENSKLGIAEIAENVGIPDRFYFSRLFKSKFGQSPLNYRKKS